MTHQRYRVSFLLSILIFLVLTMGIFSLLNIENRLQAPKKEHLVKVAILTLPKPVKKVVPKPIEPKKVVPSTPPIVKEKLKPKSTPKPKKVVKKHKPKPKPKKSVKKNVKKHKPKPIQKVHKRVVKRAKPKSKEVFEEVIVSKQIIKESIPIAQPIVKTEPKVIKSIHKTSTTPVDNSRAKRAFLQKVRSKIIANKKYPKIALRRHIESDVKVRFDITSTGQVSNIRFISGKRVFYKSIRATLAKTFPVAIPSNMRGQLPISDISVILHFNIR